MWRMYWSEGRRLLNNFKSALKSMAINFVYINPKPLSWNKVEHFILPVVLYGCETWSLTLREEHRLTVFEYRVLTIFGPKRDRETGDWRKLHNDELHKLYSLPTIIRMIKLRRMRWAGHVARMGRRGMHIGY
jgi:hypothetical protein